MTRNSFIARWSRLKGEAAQEGAQEAAAPPAPASADPPPLTTEEIAALPPVETLTPLSDIAPYLRKGVPALLRNAALRRMWSLNPAIRDYVDDAMEYAMDWNTPGAIVGNGPLAAGDDPLAMARKLMDGGKPPAPAPEAAESAEAGQSAEAAPPAKAPESGNASADGNAAGSAAGNAPAPARDAPESARRAPETEARAPLAAAPDPARRRHGGAAPS